MTDMQVSARGMPTWCHVLLAPSLSFYALLLVGRCALGATESLDDPWRYNDWEPAFLWIGLRLGNFLAIPYTIMAFWIVWTRTLHVDLAERRSAIRWSVGYSVGLVGILLALAYTT